MDRAEPSGQRAVELRRLARDRGPVDLAHDPLAACPAHLARAGGIGEVLASRHPGFAAGAHVSGSLGVQQYCVVDASARNHGGLVTVDLGLAPAEKWLNPLGMPGMTAYFGLLEVGRPQPGQTVVVSGAAGAVGQAVGQIARIKGCRAVGIAGGKAKCDFVVDELGFDACVDY